MAKTNLPKKHIFIIFVLAAVFILGCFSACTPHQNNSASIENELGVANVKIIEENNPEPQKWFAWYEALPEKSDNDDMSREYVINWLNDFSKLSADEQEAVNYRLDLYVP